MTRLQRLLENLFRNAVEHGSTNPRSHAHEVVWNTVPQTIDTLRVSTTRSNIQAPRSRSRSGPTATFYVEDDGPGVPEDDREHVFTRGFTTNEDGTGYGLQIFVQIASAHDWTVEVTDGGDGGARFELQGVRPATD